jgi:hypothetical protein
MSAVSDFFSWLFGSRLGVICLLVGGIVLFILIAWHLEHKMRKQFYNHEKSDDDWSLFGNDEDGWSDFEDDNK